MNDSKAQFGGPLFQRMLDVVSTITKSLFRMPRINKFYGQTEPYGD